MKNRYGQDFSIVWRYFRNKARPKIGSTRGARESFSKILFSGGGGGRVRVFDKTPSNPNNYRAFQTKCTVEIKENSGRRSVLYWCQKPPTFEKILHSINLSTSWHLIGVTTLLLNCSFMTYFSNLISLM